jgi:homoserine O-acetyltransferase
MVRANQLAGADPARIKTPTLIVYSPSDLVFPQPWIERTAAAIAANGTLVETVAIGGPNGHLNGVLHVAQAAPQIAAFLAE